MCTDSQALRAGFEAVLLRGKLVAQEELFGSAEALRELRTRQWLALYGRGLLRRIQIL